MTIPGLEAEKKNNDPAFKESQGKYKNKGA